MAIRALCLQDFDRFNSARARVARQTDQAVEWFADDTDTVLGAIAYHHLTLDWSLVVLRRNREGTFRAIHRAAGLPGAAYWITRDTCSSTRWSGPRG